VSTVRLLIICFHMCPLMVVAVVSSSVLHIAKNTNTYVLRNNECLVETETLISLQNFCWEPRRDLSVSVTDQYLPIPENRCIRYSGDILSSPTSVEVKSTSAT